MIDLNSNSLSHLDRLKLARDTIIIITITLLSLLLALHFNLSEQFYQWTRLAEKYQADELLFPLLSLSLCLIWFSWRRYREAKTESHANTNLLSENRLLIQNMTENQEHERLFICQELHDVFAQHLTSLRTQAELIQAISLTENSLLIDTSQKIIDNVDTLHAVTRSLLKSLRPPLLEFGVALAIEDLVTQWQHAHKTIQCQLEFHGIEPDLTEEELLTLYRTVQEGLSNISRHTQANHVNIDLYFPPNQDQDSANLTLKIINDGAVNLDIHPVKNGLGLIGIRERASMLNGHFNITPYPPDSTKLQLDFPLQTIGKPS